MSLEQDIQLLRTVKMFVDFNDEHLRLIAFGSQKMNFSQGYELYHDGQATDGGYVVISGSLDLVSYKDGNEVLLATYKRGSLLGEMALISMNKRIGTALVREDCELMKISRITMHRILNEYPELAVALQRRISHAVLDFTRELEKVRI